VKNFKKFLILIFLIFSKISFADSEIQPQENLLTNTNFLEKFSCYDNLRNLQILIQANLTKLKYSIYKKLNKKDKTESSNNQNQKISSIDLGEFFKIHDSISQNLKNINWKFEKNVLSQMEQIKTMILEYINQTGNTFIPLDKEILKSLENSVKEYIKESDNFWQQLSIAGKIWHKTSEFFSWKIWHNLYNMLSWKNTEKTIYSVSSKLARYVFDITKKLPKKIYQKLTSTKIGRLALIYIALSITEIYLGSQGGFGELSFKENLNKIRAQLSHPSFKNVHTILAPYIKKIYDAGYELFTGHDLKNSQCKTWSCEQLETMKSWFISDNSYSIIKMAVIYLIAKDIVFS